MIKTAIINGTYKKDTPNEEIGYQKWKVKKTYIVDMEYEIVAKTREKADELLDKEECIKIKDVDAYGKIFRETIIGRHVNDMQGDEPTTWKKIEECIPREDTDIDTNEKYINYDDPHWSSDDWDWLKNEDGTNIK